MKIALHYRNISPDDQPAFEALMQTLADRGIATLLPDGQCDITDANFLFSIGGDGTLLSSMQLVSPHVPFPPIVGVNFGHLGFLTTAGKEQLGSLVDDLLQGHFTLEERTLLQVADTYALNEVFLHRTEEASLLKIEASVDGQYVATYAGDGVIVATPTGSTAYSLSCGGPILTPDSRCLVLTPISAHTLTLRPVIVPDTTTIRLQAASACFLGIDSRRRMLQAGGDITIQRAPFSIRLVRLGRQNFFSAIREKLMWGTEIRT